MFVSFLIFIEGKDLFICNLCYRYFSRWTEEDETVTYFLILYLNFVFIFQFFPSVLSFISMRVSGCYPLLSFLIVFVWRSRKKT
jgi:hypothetical protein